MTDRAETFDPIRMLQVLDRHRVSYIVIGALARVIHGAAEVTDRLDIAPSPRTENLRRLGLAVQELGADSSLIGPAHQPVVLDTATGLIGIELEPEGTSGFDDLRRAASREPLGSGVRPSVASLGDLARILAAQGIDPPRLQALRRVAELQADVGRGIDR